MKKIITTVSLVVLLSFSLMASLISAVPAVEPEAENNAYEAEKAVFTEMLDKNYIFNEAFTSDADLIEGAMLSLLPTAEDGRLKKDDIAAFMLDFYGIVMNEKAYPVEYVKDDYFYYIPKGYNRPYHEIVSIERDGDTYFVISNMKLDTHDNGVEPYTVKTAFIANSSSSYGFNLINCEIVVPAESI
jgi:hypothetical protein